MGYVCWKRGTGAIAIDLKTCLLRTRDPVVPYSFIGVSPQKAEKTVDKPAENQAGQAGKVRRPLLPASPGVLCQPLRLTRPVQMVYSYHI